MEDLNVCGAEALVPADHSREALGELAADCHLAAGHGGDHSNGRAVWPAEAATEEVAAADDTCEAAPPADKASRLSGDGLGPCLRDAGHATYANYHNGCVAWPIQQEELPQPEPTYMGLGDALASLNGRLEVTA